MAKIGDEPIAPVRLFCFSLIRIVIAIARVAVVNVMFRSRIICHVTVQLRQPSTPQGGQSIAR